MRASSMKSQWALWRIIYKKNDLMNYDGEITLIWTRLKFHLCGKE